MKAFRSLASWCHVSLAVIGLAAGLMMAGCGSDTGVPASTPAQPNSTPETAVQVKGKGKASAQVGPASRRELYRQKAQASKDSP